MAELTKKPTGTFAKLMASSPLQEGQGRASGNPENPKTRKPEIRESGKPETPQSGNQAITKPRKPETPKAGNREAFKAMKYSTQLHPDVIKRLKQYALSNDVKDYEVVQEAITEYLAKKPS
jgi:hypothetical protein